MLNNKRGSLTDLAMIAAALFAFCVMMLLGYKMVNAFNTEIQTMPEIPQNAKTSTDKMEAHFPGILDNSLLFLAVGLGIVAFALAALVRVHPVFIFFYLVLIEILVCGALSNVYEEMASSPQLITLASNLTFATILMRWLPLIVGTIGSLLAIVMYKSWREGG